ncbi:hypothetical protein F5Y10DRAFT_229604 [Nemania abortiva]|nr:hypothetical protein F5Y10DRAFT_229604 [Nemania abortiva]
MGGQAFASDPDPLFTPRMKPHVYRAVRDRCQEKLRDLFIVVATPIEGPAKASFGDIDLFVAWERKDVFPPSGPAPDSASNKSPKDAVCRALGAIRWMSTGSHIVTMAIPWPEDFPYSDVESKIEPKTEPSSDVSMNDIEGERKDGEDDPKIPYIQVDIHICQSLTYLQWMLFKHAHGDLWNLLGSTTRPFGLTIDEVGLYIRIPEIEEFNKKQAKVLLSMDPSEILHFIGLKFGEKEWEEPFASDEDMFEYAATCRLFCVKTKDPEAEADEEGETAEADKKKLKANDRRRIKSRPLFKKWIEEFIPACRDAGRFLSTGLDRDIVREQAFEYFPGVQLIYNSRILDWRIKKQREALWKDVIKPAVPSDMHYDRRGPCCSALKKIILHEDESFGGIVAPPSLKNEDGLFDEDAVRVWVENNWQRVLDAALGINQKRLAAKAESKGATKRAGSSLEKPVDREFVKE